MKTRFLASLLIIAAAILPCAAGQGDGPLVAIQDGALRGSRAVGAAGVESFRGIPFAAPPVGDRRWRPPAPPAAWTGERAALTYGADCAQKPFPPDDAPLATIPAEDCLYLNVWRPAGATGPLPVMVWIHGGGFVNGGTSPAIYDGSQLARGGVVVVSANHRLGRFGFFAHPALTAEAGGGPNANYGFMDQIAALRWVAANIGAFGGNPADVTIFGESAGGVSVNMLLTSPLARGLFARAIVMSGGGRSNLLPNPTLAGGEAIGLRFAQGQGVHDAGPDGLAALRALPAERLVGDLNLATLSATPDYSGPVIDGALLGGEVLALIRAGRAAPVPVMVGATSGDGWHDGGDKAATLSAFGPLRAAAAALYDPTGTESAETVGHRVHGDARFIEPARATARALAAHGAPVYQYRFSYVAQNRRAQWDGAQHAKELPFIFDQVLARYGTQATPADRTAARQAQAYWLAFARTGVPAPDGLPAAPRLTPGDDRLIDFTNDGPMVRPDPLTARLDLTERRMERGF